MNFMSYLSRNSAYAGNPIEEEDHLAAKMVASGKTVIKLNRGDPAAYFPTPKYIVDAYVKALKAGKTGYSYHAGIPELRTAVAKRYMKKYGTKINPESVIVTQGVSEAILSFSSMFLDMGDRAVIFRPYYTLYMSSIMVCGGKPLIVDCAKSDRYEINPEALSKALRKVRTKPKYMIFSNPSNPAGAVMGRDTLEKIVDIANDNGIFLISDEIYDEIVYNGAKFVSISQIARGVPHAILGGASKDFDATGFRMGYAIIPGEDKKSAEIREKFADYAKMRLSSNTPAQYAFAEAISNSKMHVPAVAGMVSKIESRANFAYKLVGECEYLSPVRPRGAFYLLARIDMKRLNFRSDKEIVSRLLTEENVQVTRGSGFGADGSIRIVALAPENVLEEAIGRINKFFARYSK